MNPGRKDHKHLLDHIRRLQPYIEDEDTLASVVGYAIVSSLHSFTTNTGADEQRMFEEVKHVYGALEKVLSSYRSEGEGVDLELEAQVQRVLSVSGSSEDDSERHSSLLYTSILQVHPNLNVTYRDVLKRRSQMLIRRVQDNGRIKGRRNQLLNDYESIRESYVEN